MIGVDMRWPVAAAQPIAHHESASLTFGNSKAAVPAAGGLQTTGAAAFSLRRTLTNGRYAANNPAHEHIDRSYCGGNAHGQDGVTIRR
jgi:hypothetical protein